MITLSSALIALAGGALLGLSATVLLAFNGRIAGISGIAGGLLGPAPGESGWRIAFLAGLLGAGAVVGFVLPDAIGSSPRPVWLLVPPGLLVGFGTRLGNGCTSGHGICGLARGSKRSLVAVLVFLVTGLIGATVSGQIFGGVQ